MKSRSIRPLYVVILLELFLLWLLFGNWSGQTSGATARKFGCMSNVKQMLLGVLSYSDDHDDHMPITVGWMDTLKPIVASDGVFRDPTETKLMGYGYAYHDKASWLKTADIENPSGFVVIFDSTLPGRSAHGDLTSLPKGGRHGSTNIEGFANGEAEAVEAH